MTSTVKKRRELAKSSAESILNTNDGLLRTKSNDIFSILEWSAWTGSLRDRVDHYLNQMMTRRGITTERDELREKCSSVKEKIAHTVGVLYDHEIYARATEGMATPPAFVPNAEIDPLATFPIDDAMVKEKLDETIKYLQDSLISKEEFNESWIMRNAALNIFECWLTWTERAELNDIAIKIKEVTTSNYLNDLTEATDFTNESDAQKIWKLKGIMSQITAEGITVEGWLIKKVDDLEKKLQPLKDLDMRYKHLTNMLNITDETARTYKKSQIDISSQKKLNVILKELWKNEEDFIMQPDVKEGKQWESLKDKLSELKKDGKYREIMEKNKVSESVFDEWFLVYFNYCNVKEARGKLKSQKKFAFWHKEKDYDLAINTRRWGVRERIFEIANRMTWEGATRAFENDADYNTICSYFNKFQNIFYANERDAYNNENGISHFAAMRDVLAAMFRQKVPAICNWSHAYYGAMPRRMVKWFEWFLKGREEKWIFKIIKKRWKDWDHAQILAMVIMLQNQTDQSMFHGEKDPFQKSNTRFSKIYSGLWAASDGREKIAETISPYARGLLRTAEVSIAKVGGVVVKWAESYNGTLKKYKRYKTPFYLLYPATWIAAQWWKVYAGVKKYLSEIQWKQVDNIYGSVVNAVNETSKFIAGGISKVGTTMSDIHDTNTQRDVLDSFFACAAENEHWREVLQSSDLTNMFSTKHRGAYLFDQDGRVPAISQTKRHSEDATGVKNILKDNIGKLYPDLQKQFSTRAEDIRKNYETMTEKLEGLTYWTPEYDKAQAEMLKLGVSLDELGEQKWIFDSLLLSLHEYSIGTIPTANGFVNVATQDITLLKNLYDDGEKLVDNNDSLNPWLQQQIKKNDKETAEKEIELKAVETKIWSAIHENDESSTTLNSERSDLEAKIGVFRTKIRAKKGEENDAQSDADWFKRTWDSLEKRKSRLEDELDKLPAAKTTLEDLEFDHAAKETELTKATNPDVIKKLIKEIGELDRQINQKKGLFNRWNPQDYIDEVKKSITEIEKKINENRANEQKKKWNVGTAQDEQQNLTNDMNKEIKKLDEVNAKLSKKWPADKSWVEIQTQKNTLLQSIEDLKWEKKELTKKLNKQEAKNKVYSKLYKRSSKVGKFGATMNDIANKTTLTDKERSKLSIQAVKDVDIQFNINKNVKKVTLADLSKEEKDELVNALKLQTQPISAN